MERNMNVEILAPGGSREAIYAGIYSGADAVYTGTSRFSARAFADNPDVEELCRIVDFAHLHGKKIYLTVNTLLTEEELERSLFDVVKPLYETGLDAVIVQDFGVLEFLHSHFPDMDLHASTQMTLLTAEAANLLKPYGVTRIVPARELTIQEITQMRQKTDLELEVFVHGALCYCYSGQCLMSKVIGGRSGNRGMCAQPCRLPYETDGKNAGYLLSPKDLCTLEHTGELIEAGVDSFKIEGRMKKPAYTAYTAYLYRAYADAYLSGLTPADAEVRRDIRRLADIYNRGGFSGGYLFETSKKPIVYTKKNGHFGVCVGEVTAVNKKTVEYRVTQRTHYQDVLEFRNERDEGVYEYTVKEGAEPGERVAARYQKGSLLKKGQKVYRTKNAALLEETDTLIEHGKEACLVPVNGRFTGKCGQEVRLELWAGNVSCAVSGVTAEPASGHPVSSADIEKRLKKTGGSEFVFDRLDVELEEGLFIPLGGIAALRRRGLDVLTEKILSGFHREVHLIQDKKDSKGMETRDFTLIQVTDFCQIEGVKSVLKGNADDVRLHLKLEDFAPADWERLANEAAEFRYYISLPAVLRMKNKEHFLEHWETYGSCFQESSCVGIILNSLEALPVIRQMKDGSWELIAGSGMYMWNRRTEKVYQELGISGHLYMAYGRTAVMMTEGCVGMQLSGCCKETGEKRRIDIRTPKKDEFTVVNVCDYCYNVIYEKNPGWHEPEDLADIPEIAFTFEDADEVREVLKQWNFLS